MKPSEFEQWCHRLQLSAPTRSFIEKLRISPPVRRVQGRAMNVSGAYTSRKMGVTIQFESHKVELWAVYLMEYDAQVFEYFDQASTLTLEYESLSGRKVVAQHTPDFFVIRADGAGFEEWKQEEKLLELAITHPSRYQRDPQGGWCCPPGEAAAARLGLSYRVRSSTELHPVYVRNLIFLEDYFFEYSISHEAAATLLDAVETTPGRSITDLHRDFPHMSIDVLYALIARNRLYADLYAAPLKDHARTHLYPNQTVAEAHSLLLARKANAPTVNLHANTPLLWDGRQWTLLNLGQTMAMLLPDVGSPIQLETTLFLRLVEAHTITVPDDSHLKQQVALSQEVHRLLTEAGPEALDVANMRFRVVQAYQKREKDFYANVAPRTIRGWQTLFRDAEARYGCGYVGLLPKTKGRGNRSAKASEQALALLEDAITSVYARPKHQRIRDVYPLYQQACQQQGIKPVCERTFYRKVKAHGGTELTEKRRGARAAYQESSWHWELEMTTPRHGDRPWEIAHIDHTQLDIELVSSFGMPLGRPWATFLMDAYSRRVLACYLTFDPPSYRSAMMALRLCVQRHGRLPQTLVVDGGKEFHSRYFDVLLGLYNCTKKNRPWAQPRYGSVSERLFGTTNTQFVYNLLGNTQASKQPRQMTRVMNPKHQAVWQLCDLCEFLCEWLYDIYDQAKHVTLGQSPREAWAVGLAYGGMREHCRIPYDETFLMATLPSTPRETALIHPSRGITVHYLSYWNEIFRRPDVARTKVPVRYDPFDIGVIYAYVHQRWVECISNYYGQFRGHSEKELLLATAEIREQNRRNRVPDPITAKRLADFLERVEEHEAIRLQRLRDQEIRAMFRTIEGQTGVLPQTNEPILAERSTESENQESLRQIQEETSLFAPVDVSKLHVYEEYR